MECRCLVPADCARCTEQVCANVVRRVAAAGCVPLSSIGRLVSEHRPLSAVVVRLLAKRALRELFVVDDEARSPLYHARALLAAEAAPVELDSWARARGLPASVAGSIAYRPGPQLVVFRGPAGRWHAKRRRGLGAHDLPSLLRALEGRGCLGTPLASIYGEYESAHTDVHRSPAVFIAHGLAWHTSVAGGGG